MAEVDLEVDSSTFYGDLMQLFVLCCGLFNVVGTNIRRTREVR